MAITVVHDNIASIMGLAAAAGQAQAQRQKQGTDLQYLQLLQRAKEQQDQNAAQQIQMALGVQQHNVENQQQADNTTENRALREQQLQATIESQAASRAISQQNADSSQKQVQLASDKQTQAAAMKAQQLAQQKAYIESLPDSPDKQKALAYFNASGKLPETVVPKNPTAASTKLTSDPQVQMLQFEAQHAKDTMNAARKERQNYVRDNFGADDKDPQFRKLQQDEATASQKYNDTINLLKSQMENDVSNAQPAAPQAPSPADQITLPNGLLNPNMPKGYSAVNIAGKRGVLDAQNAQAFLQMANGDKSLARQLATQAGFIVQ